MEKAPQRTDAGDLLKPAEDRNPDGANPAAPEDPPSWQLRRRRRKESRYDVDDSAAVYLVRVGSTLRGRILDMSGSGCRIRTNDRFSVGIYTYVEIEFCHRGMPFRLAGVIQAIHDRNTMGVRFLDLSERKRRELEELIEDLRGIAESSAVQPPS